MTNNTRKMIVSLDSLVIPEPFEQAPKLESVRSIGLFQELTLTYRTNKGDYEESRYSHVDMLAPSLNRDISL